MLVLAGGHVPEDWAARGMGAGKVSNLCASRSAVLMKVGGEAADEESILVCCWLWELKLRMSGLFMWVE